jgi:predicted nucleic acid-binding protein
MIVVVSDTSPLRDMVLVEQVEVLPRLFDQVLVPPVVLREMSQVRTPDPVRARAASPPAWLTVREPSSLDPSLNLGAGEQAALALAQEVQAARILVDDRDAVRAARTCGLTPIGTLALLDEAAERGLAVQELLGHRHVTTTRIYDKRRRSLNEGASHDVPI